MPVNLKSASPLTAPRSPSKPPRPPLTLLGTESLRAAREFMSLNLAGAPPDRTGDSHPAVIFPGLSTDGRAVAPLRKHYLALGYTAMDWGPRSNAGPQGDVDSRLARLADDISGKVARYNQPATLIGWSLGSICARELAKLIPAEQLRQVITIGTPFNTAAGGSNVAWLFRLLSRRPAVVDAALGRRLVTPPPLPTTSICSKSDGVVAWQSCRHKRPAPQAQDIEVVSSHIGMGWNPAVLSVIADRLAQKPDDWCRYRLKE